MNIKKLLTGFTGFKLTCCKTQAVKERMTKVDLGILKVAFMVAALDGEVTDEEYEAFEALAKKCRGYTPENAAVALKESMRSAGYLMLVSRRCTTADLVKEFLAEAKQALPDGFAYDSIEDVRRALVIWIAIGMSDGNYSERERVCIEALRKEFAEIAIKREDLEDERWAGMSPTFRMAYGGRRRVTLVDRSFVSRVEELAAKYGDSQAAAAELRKLVR